MKKKRKIITIVIIMICILNLGIIKNYAVNSTNNIVNQETIVENKAGLSNLNIKDLNLEPTFSSMEYSYKVKYIGEKTSLEIEATPADESYTVDITGNEDLIEGENIITILVSESTGKNIATYQIIVNKSLKDYEAIEKQKAEEEKKKKIIIASAIAAVVLIIIIAIIIKRRKSDEYYWEDEDYDEDEKPKALKNDEEENFDDMPKHEVKKRYLSNFPEIEENEEQNAKEKEENFEEMSKDEIKEKFLNNYSNYEEQYKEKPKKKKHSKGKRFK